jgi:hypothetical protein
MEVIFYDNGTSLTGMLNKKDGYAIEQYDASKKM